MTTRASRAQAATFFTQRDIEAQPAYWSSVFAMSLCVFALIASEPMPVSLRMPIAADRRAMELTYTVLRPVWLINKPTEAFELTRKGDAYKDTETSRSSIGSFVVDRVKDPQRYANQNLGISQPGTDGDRPAAYR